MHVEVHGRSEPDAPTVLLSSGLGGSAAYWAPQIESLALRFRVVCYDHRGTGRTGGTLRDGHCVADMAADVVEILADLRIANCHVVGHALGGLIGLQLALDRPDLLASLTVVNGWASADGHTARCFAVRKALLHGTGAAAYVQAQPIFLYPAVWLSDNAAHFAAEEAAALAHFPGHDTVLKRIAAVLAFDVAERLAEIRTPTLVLGSRDDILVPYTRSSHLAAGISGAQLVVMGSGAHACNITEPGEFNRILGRFLGVQRPV